tara:strand:+ start:94 stop:591 length:498 start_codon:yes stop_codon:yes gene_type:complete
MWVVIKYKINEFSLLRKELKNKLGEDTIIYRPKIVYQNFSKNKIIHKEFNILGDYFFCFNKKFEDKLTIKNLNFLKGLKYILNGFYFSQLDISNFIKKCKNLENEKGLISKNIYELSFNKLYKFLNGPFNNKIFKILQINKNFLSISIGEINATINREKLLFSPI